MTALYILDGHEPVPCNEPGQWVLWFGSAGPARIVRQSDVADCRVSTMFVGVDRSWGEGPPLLFETMVFGPYEGENRICTSTWDHAERMHSRTVGAVLASRSRS